MGSSRSPAPAQQQTAQQPEASPYTIDADGNINVTGNITGEQLSVAQKEAATIRAQKAESTKNKEIYGNESVADVQAREQSTLANPKKAKVRGKRSLISESSIGTGVTSSRETLG